MEKKFKFKKGDKIVVIAYPNPINSYVGRTGVVLKATKDALQGNDFIVTMLEGDEEETYFFRDEIEKLIEKKEK